MSSMSEPMSVSRITGFMAWFSGSRVSGKKYVGVWEMYSQPIAQIDDRYFGFAYKRNIIGPVLEFEPRQLERLYCSPIDSPSVTRSHARTRWIRKKVRIGYHGKEE